MIFDEIKKGMSDAAQVINSNFLKITSETGDTGWLDLPLKTNFSAGTSKPQYRKIGNRVEVRGQLVRASDAKGIFCTLPVGFRTSSTYNQGFVQGQQTSGSGASALVYARPNGDLEVVSTTNDTAVWLDGIYFYID
ncbi:hypothetical protein ABW287_000474 [Listeria monocytogenes]